MLEARAGKERYSIEERIGVGSTGAVYRALDGESGRKVAIKLFDERFSEDPRFVAHFRDDVRESARLHHPNVVETLDYGRWDTRYYVVMELVEGKSLRRYLADHGHIGVDAAVDFLLQTCAALEVAHAHGVLHRDIKPEHLLLTADGTLRVCDFGLLGLTARSAATTTGAALGTVQYMAPEVIQDKSPSAAADVYALGVVLYELLTGRPPFTGYSPVAAALRHVTDDPIPPRSLQPAIPKPLEAVVLKALAKRPEGRYEDAGALRAALIQVRGSADRAAAAHSATLVGTKAPGRPAAVGQLPPLRAWIPLGALVAALFGAGMLLAAGGSSSPIPVAAVEETPAPSPTKPVADASVEPPVDEATPVEAEQEPPAPVAPPAAPVQAPVASPAGSSQQLIGVATASDGPQASPSPTFVELEGSSGGRPPGQPPGSQGQGQGQARGQGHGQGSQNESNGQGGEDGHGKSGERGGGQGKGGD